MPSNRTSFRAVCLALLAAPLALGGCTSDWGVSPMPTGYKFLNNNYKVTGNGPAPMRQYPGVNAAAAAMPQDAQPASGDTASAAPMPAVEKAEAAAAPATSSVPAIAVSAGAVSWNRAAEDLLGKLEKSFGRIKDPVSVREALPGRADETAFAAALKTTLDARGYKTGEKDKAPFALDYMVVGQPSGDTLVSLTAYAQGKQIAQEDGRYPPAAADTAAAPKAEEAAIPVLVSPDVAAPKTEEPKTQQADKRQPVEPETAKTSGPPPALTVEEGAVSAEMKPEEETPRTYIFGRSQAGGGRTAYEERTGSHEGNIVIAAPADEESPAQ